MEISKEKLNELSKRLILARTRILSKNGFYGLLLMHAKFALEDIETASTDGDKIYFGPDFISTLSDSELDFVLMHEILHIVLAHCQRTGNRDNRLFNIACDIVVNSNIMFSEGGNEESITIKKYGALMHKTPNGDEGYKYSAEQVYEMLIEKGKKEDGKGRFDSHDKWGTLQSEEIAEDWERRMVQAGEAVSSRPVSAGGIPFFMERILKQLRESQIDWRTILNNFIQEEVNDYSFAPPDRRFDGGDFYLPDFNDYDESVKDVLFMVDTSASMGINEITNCFAEIQGAIAQFNGKLQGYLGFFDAQVVEPKPFSSQDEFKLIKPYGGGGTSFFSIFNYVNEKMEDKNLSSIIILTDGYATFPPKEIAKDIPVLWVINNEKVDPPWGKVVRIT